MMAGDIRAYPSMLEQVGDHTINVKIQRAVVVEPSLPVLSVAEYCDVVFLRSRA